MRHALTLVNPPASSLSSEKIRDPLYMSTKVTFLDLSTIGTSANWVSQTQLATGDFPGPLRLSFVNFAECSSM